MQLISDRDPDRDLPVPNRRDERRGAVRVPDGAAAGQADVAAEAGERPDEVEAAEPAAGSAKANSRGIPAVCTGVLRNSSSDRPNGRDRNCLDPLSLQGVSDADQDIGKQLIGMRVGQCKTRHAREC